MYHRYQPDGNGRFTRRIVPDPPKQTPLSASSARKQTPVRPSAPPPPVRPPVVPPPVRPPVAPPPARPNTSPQMPPPAKKSALGMERSDLPVLFLLLLLISEGTEDAASMALTLGIYLFMK